MNICYRACRVLSPSIFIGSLLFAAVALMLPGAADEAVRFDSDYSHVVYNVSSNTPIRVYGGEMSLDLTTRERFRQILGELRALGVNVTTPLTSFGPNTIYPTEIPELTHAAGWADRDLDGLQMLLDTCEKLDMACYPAVWLYRAATPELADKTQRELFAKYGDHPAFKGFVPPVEANPGMGFNSEDFIGVAAAARELKPGMVIMDYPNGPFAFHIVQTIMDRSLSGTVDVQNVQYHPSDDRWEGSFLFARGLFHLVLGICPGVRSIVHTHYKYGGGKRWIELDDLYRTHQAATITATPHGTSIYSFPHAMWGGASSYNCDDPMQRRIAWYKGIINSQRMLPYFENARPANSVAIMVPRHIREAALDYLRRTYVPVAEAAIGVHMFVNEQNMGEGVRGVIVRGLGDCSPEQLGLMQDLVAGGGHLLVIHTPSPAVPDDLSERTQRILGVSSVRKWEPSGIDSGFAAALGLDDATGKMDVEEPREAEYGKGTVSVVPFVADPLEANGAALVGWVEEHLPDRMTAVGLSPDFTVDRWRKQDANTDLDMVMFMGTADGAAARDVTLSMPVEREYKAAWLLMADRVEKLEPECADGMATVDLRRLDDEFNAVIFTDATYPLLLPEERVVRCSAGDELDLRVRLRNALDGELSAQVTAHAPEGWAAPEPAQWQIKLKEGRAAEIGVRLRVPDDVVARPHFARFECCGITQRVLLFPENGTPQVFSDHAPEEFARPATATPPKPRPQMGSEWLDVLASQPTRENPAAHRPGVCFLPGNEWDAPAEHEGKVARYGERIPRLAAPNFLVNDPPTDGEIEVRITYWSSSGGVMHAYDGKQYHPAAQLTETGKWATATGRVGPDIINGTDADRRPYPGLNIMFDVDCADVYVHKIEVRAAE